MTNLVLVVAVLLFVWAFAEAFVWPIVPDVALASCVFLVPDAAVLFTLAAVAGSVIGGTTAMHARRVGRRWPLPMVSERMRASTATWLEAGPIGLVHQPLSAVPYKAFVVEGARREFRTAAWAWWTIVFRGARMMVVGVATVIAAHVAADMSSVVGADLRFTMLGTGLVVFAAGWHLAWRRWNRDDVDGTRHGAARTMHP